MKNKILSVQLMPSFQATIKKLGYTLVEEELDWQEVLFQQTVDIINIDVETGQYFEISKDCFKEGTVFCYYVSYIFVKKFWISTYSQEIVNDILVLPPGKYLYHNNGVIIEQVQPYVDCYLL